jgi:Trk K+ transport system NAD-binding subunit
MPSLRPFGIVVFSLALLFRPGTAAKRIAFTEAMEEDLLGGTKAHAHRVVCYYREGRFSLANEESRLRKGDEMVILTHSENIGDLRERWEPKQSDNEGS